MVEHSKQHNLSLCTFLLTENPSAGFAQGYHPSENIPGAGFPEFTRFFNHSFPWKLQFLQPIALPIELPRITVHLCNGRRVAL